MTTINTNNTANLNLAGNTTTVKQQLQQTPIGQASASNTKVAVEQQQQQSALPQSSSSTPNHLLVSSLKPINSGIPKPSQLHPNSILKPALPTSSKSHVPIPSHSYNTHLNDFNLPPPSHLNLKYPPDVPKPGYHLSDPFAPHNLHTSKNIPPYRPPPSGRTNQIRLPPSAIQHHHPPLPPVPSTSIHRLTPHNGIQQSPSPQQLLGEGHNSDLLVQPPPVTRLTANHLQQAQQQAQQQQQQQSHHLSHAQEMLKFVRKADSDTSSATTSSNSGRLSVEQPTKHIQVSVFVNEENDFFFV